MKRCVLDETSLCTDCGDCERCSLNPDKRCDSCCACLEETGAYRVLRLEDLTRALPRVHGADKYRVARTGKPGAKNPRYGIRLRT